MRAISTREVTPLLIALLAVVVAGSFQDADWFSRVNQPTGSSPVFPLVLGWACYYLAVMVELRRTGWAERATRLGSGLIAGQLAMIVCWSALFFVLNRPGWALAPLMLAVCLAFYCLVRGGNRTFSARAWKFYMLAWLMLFWAWCFGVWLSNGGL